MFKRASNCACTSSVVISPSPLLPSPSTSSAIGEEAGEEDPEPADEGDVQTEYSSDPLYSPSTGAERKYYLQELRSA